MAMHCSGNAPWGSTFRGRQTSPTAHRRKEHSMRMILSSHVPGRPSTLPLRTAALEPRWEFIVRSLLKMTGTLQILFVILSAVSQARVVDRTEQETPNI